MVSRHSNGVAGRIGRPEFTPSDIVIAATATFPMTAPTASAPRTDGF
jgi:hypothetical protein